MAKIYCLLFVLCRAVLVQAQVVAIQNEKQNTLYIGVNNYLTIAVEQCPGDTVQVSSTAGSLVPLGEKEHNHYNILVDSPGYVMIEVKKKTGNEYKIIGNQRYKASYLPDPVPYYARRRGGELSVADMDEGFVPMAKQPGYEKITRYVMDSFTVLVLRGDKLAYAHKEAGNAKMADATLAFFRSLKPGDKLLFTGLSCTGRDKRKTRLPVMEFDIVKEHGNEHMEEKE